MASPSNPPAIPGTTLFDGNQAQKGYALNKMCFSFNSAESRAEFRKDEAAYMARYGLGPQQAAAIRNRDVLGLLAAGGNVYYLAKFAGILGLDVQDLGAAQTGLSKEAFKARLVAQNNQSEIRGAAPEYRNADEGWGIPTLPPFRGIPDLSWHIINHLVEQEFDITTCQEMLVDHAFTLPLKLFWPQGDCPVLTVPVCINTVQFPLPSAKRCVALGRAVGQAIASWESDRKVVVIGTGGLSHQLDGERAGFINKAFDLKFMDSLVNDPQWAAQYSIHELVEKTGTQGVELLMWLATRAAVPGQVRKVHTNYHIPISNTAAGMMALEAIG